MLSVVNDLGVINFLVQSNRQSFHNVEQFRLVLKGTMSLKQCAGSNYLLLQKAIFFFLKVESSSDFTLCCNLFYFAS